MPCRETVVNIASACGLKGQLAELQSLYTTHKDRHFTVLGFPSNSFGGWMLHCMPCERCTSQD